MKISNYQAREAMRAGLQREIDRAGNSRFQRHMRAIRAENTRRTAAAA